MADAKGKIGFWTMLQNVLIASMSKGQFPLALVGVILLSIIWRMPEADVSKLAFDILHDLRSGYLVGYAGFVLVTGGWFAHARYQRRMMNDEVERVSEERNRVQQAKLGSGKVKSSRK